MAKGTQNVRRALNPTSLMPGDPLSKKLKAEARRAERKTEEKGFTPETAHLEAKEAEREQKIEVKKRKQVETLKLAEAESEVGRRKLMRKTGGRRSLIASR